MLETIAVNKIDFKVIKLLGKGKGGYSYLVEKDNCLYVLKQIHHEPCAYYQFGDKLEPWNRKRFIGKDSFLCKGKRN